MRTASVMEITKATGGVSTQTRIAIAKGKKNLRKREEGRKFFRGGQAIVSCTEESRFLGPFIIARDSLDPSWGSTVITLKGDLNTGGWGRNHKQR